MAHGETYSGLYEYFEGDLYATVDVIDKGDGWVSTWLISRNLRNNLGVELLGRFVFPVWGETKVDAVRRTGFIYESVVNFAAEVSGGEGLVGNGGDVVSARRHCKAHLQYWQDIVGGTKTSRTADLYLLAIAFGVNNPAALIAEVEVLDSVRTVHDRLAHARRIGLLDSHGRGRTQRGGDSSGEDGFGSEGSQEGGSDFDIFGKTELGFKHRNSDGEWV
jgi:hypothetical protein